MPPLAPSVTAPYFRPASPLWNGKLDMESGTAGVGGGEGLGLGLVSDRGVVGGKALRGGAQAARIIRNPTERTAQPLLTTLHAGVYDGRRAARLINHLDV